MRGAPPRSGFRTETTKLASRGEQLKYLQTGERYWYNDDWFGSEKRKNPA